MPRQPSTMATRTGDEHRQDRRLPTDHRAEGVGGQFGHLGQRDDRRGHRAEGDGRGVGDEGQHGGLHRLEPQRHQHHRGDRDRGAEAGQRLEQGAEREGDDDGLDALVVADPANERRSTSKCPVSTVMLVHPDRVDDDPQDREEAERGALGARQQRLADRHAVHQHRDRRWRRPARSATPPTRSLFSDAEQHEQQQQGNRRDQRTPREGMGNRIENLLVHERTSMFDLWFASHGYPDSASA